MASDDRLIPLDEWSTLQRPRALVAVDLAIGFLAGGKVDAALAVLQALAHRFDVDQSVEEYFHQHDQLDGGECYELHQ